MSKQTPNRRDYRRRIPYESYAQLIRMVVPRTKKVIFYDHACSPTWISDGLEEPELRNWVEDLLSAAGRSGADRTNGALHINESAEPSYLLVLRDEGDQVLAVMGIVSRAPPANAEPARLSTLELMLKPVIDIARQELMTRREASDTEKPAVPQTPTSANLNLDAELAANPEAHILKRLTMDLDGVLAALIVPEYALQMTHAIGPQGDRTGPEALAKAQQHVLTWLQIRRQALMVNKVRTHDERLPPFKLLAAPITHRSGRLIGMLILFRSPLASDFAAADLTQIEQAAQYISEKLDSQYDSVTGQLAREAFEVRAKDAITRASVLSPCSLAYLDIDDLNRINDAFGYLVGDQAIAAVGALLRPPLLPEGSLASKIYGDRFAVLLPNRSATQAVEVMERLSAAAADSIRLGDLRRVHVSLSIGVAETSSPTSSLEHLLAAAEFACKNAKQPGHQRIEIYRSAAAAQASREENLAAMARVRGALDAGAFQLYAQTIAPLRDAHLPTRFEILVRLNDAGTLHAPEKFLASAIECQLMPEVDRWVVRHCLAQIKHHTEVVLGNNIEFCLNIAGQSLAQAGFVDFLESEIAAASIPADLIMFEITERDALANPGATQIFVQRAAALGCRIAIDNFGVGLASLGSLKTLNIACLKIDGSLVRDVVRNTHSEALVGAVAQLARGMEIETVAECVESDQIREKLLSMGIDYAQGFAVGRPYPLDAMLAEFKLMELLAADAEATAAGR